MWLHDEYPCICMLNSHVLTWLWSSMYVTSCIHMSCCMYSHDNWNKWSQWTFCQPIKGKQKIDNFSKKWHFHVSAWHWPPCDHIDALTDEQVRHEGGKWTLIEGSDGKSWDSLSRYYRYYKYYYPMTHILSESEATITRCIWSHIPVLWFTSSGIWQPFWMPLMVYLIPLSCGIQLYNDSLYICHIPFPFRGISNSIVPDWQDPQQVTEVS